MNVMHSFLIVMVAAGVTIALRFLPFVIFNNRKTPEFVDYLGRVLPYAIMAMLVVFCLKGLSFVNAPHGIPELICVGIVAVCHVWKRNTLFSIIAGTACYMFLVQMVF